MSDKIVNMGRENILSPSVLSADFTRLGEDVRLSENKGVNWLHFDVMDGIFVPQISVGMPVLSSLSKFSESVMDVHLMITEPERYIDQFADAGADIITFHQEACFDCNSCIEAIKRRGKKAGMTIRPYTGIEALFPYLDKIDMVLLMSVEPGFGGHKYIPSSTEKIRRMRRAMDEAGFLDMPLEVDGGIKTDNLEEVLEAGANVIVAGSAIVNGDIVENTGKFLERLRKN